MAGNLHIALVTPFSWSMPSAVNEHVAALAKELKSRGHLPVVVASSDDRGEDRRMRTLFHRNRGQLVKLLEEYRKGEPADPLLYASAGVGPLGPETEVPVIPMGAISPMRLGGGVVNLGLPPDVTSRLEKLMLGARFDLVHVHEPVSSSLSFSALREARSPVVATFHLTPLGVATYELSQSLLGRFFSRLDGRIVTFPAGRTIMEEMYAGEYEVVASGTGVLDGSGEEGAQIASAAESLAGPFALYVYRGDGRRSYRAFVRALIAAFPSSVKQVVVALHRASAERWVPRSIPRRLASKMTVLEFDKPQELAPVYRAATATVLPFLGGEWLYATAAEAMVCGCPSVGPDLPVARDCLGVESEETAGPRGAVFSPIAVGALNRALELVQAGENSHGGAETRVGDEVAASHRMGAVAEAVSRVYEQTIAATSGRQGVSAKTPVMGYSLHVRGIGEEPLRRRLREAAAAGLDRPDWINADLHIHTNFSKDCATPVETILETARELGLGAIAIADHNEIEGALLAEELCGGDPFVIVAEEVKTAEGEVIGLFLKEVIPAGLSFDETLSLIKEQGGLVYVPHPFDAMRTTPTYRTMVDNLHRIDVIEIYNAKVAFSSFNHSAERFAAKYNIVAGAGSDAHVPQGLGTAMIRMPRFDDPQSFMAALWEADIIAKRKSLLYLQSLKLLQTTLDRVLPEDLR